MGAMTNNGKEFRTGSIYVESDTNSLQIDVGINCKSFAIFVTDQTLVSDVRNLAAIYHIENDGYIYETGCASNATGSTYAVPGIRTEIGSTNTYSVSINGTIVTVSGTIVTAAKFVGGKTYKWFAYA